MSALCQKATFGAAAKMLPSSGRGRRIDGQFSSRRGSSSLTPLKSRNSIPCSSKIVRIALKFRSCIGGVPSTFSPREIAERETPQRSDKSRTDHLSNARAARSCAPVMARLEFNLHSGVPPDTPAAKRSTLRCSPQLRFGVPRRSSRRSQGPPLDI
jgi:hypothetical protein